MVWKVIGTGKGWDRAFMLWRMIIWSWLQVLNRLSFSPPSSNPLFFSVQDTNPTPAIPQVFVTVNYICN